MCFGRARLQPCRPEPQNIRALAPERRSVRGFSIYETTSQYSETRSHVRRLARGTGVMAAYARGVQEAALVVLRTSYSESQPCNRLLTNFWPRRTASMAGTSSLPVSIFRTYPFAPLFKAARTTSVSVFWVTKMTFAPGATCCIRLAVSIPFRCGRPISSKIRSGCSSWIF